MTLLQRYFWKQAFWPLTIFLLSLAVLALLTQSLSTLDLIVENRQSTWTFLYITVLAMPQLISIIMPLAIFMATLFALNRLNMDSELVVTKATGFSPWQISSPIVRLSVLALVLHLFINLALQPYSFRQMRQAIFEVRTDLASQLVRPGEFMSPVPDLTVFARKISPGGRLEDVMIYDARSAEGAQTHTAETGLIVRTKTQLGLTLYKGNVQKFDPVSGDFDLITFEEYNVDLTDVIMINSMLRLKKSDRYLHELFKPDLRDRANRKYINVLAAEGHNRLSAPLYNIALVLLALSFMVRGQHQRMGYGRRIAVCALIGFLIRLTGFGLAAASEETRSLNAAQYALPIIVALLCLWFLFNRNRAQKLTHMLRRQTPARLPLPNA